MAVQLGFVDPSGDGTAYPAPFPQGLDKTVYNGSKGCDECGVLMTPVIALGSDLCPGCSKRKAANQVRNRMA